MGRSSKILVGLIVFFMSGSLVVFNNINGYYTFIATCLAILSVFTLIDSFYYDMLEEPNENFELTVKSISKLFSLAAYNTFYFLPEWNFMGFWQNRNIIVCFILDNLEFVRGDNIWGFFDKAVLDNNNMKKCHTSDSTRQKYSVWHKKYRRNPGKDKKYSPKKIKEDISFVWWMKPDSVLCHK